jgi:alpha-L-arabinofuranosidase
VAARAGRPGPRKYEHYQEYLKRIPALRAKPVPIAIDEWAYFGGGPNSYKTVPAYAWAFPRDVPPLRCFPDGRFTFATATMSSNRTEAYPQPHRNALQDVPRSLRHHPRRGDGDSPQPKPTFPAGGDQPAVNPGSDTYPLDVSAALSAKIARLSPLPCSIHPTPNRASDRNQRSEARQCGQIVAHGSGFHRRNGAGGQEARSQVEEQTLGALPDTITVRPFSVNIYSYPVQ